MTILDTIIAKKRIEVAAIKTEKSVVLLERSPLFSREVLSLSRSLLDPDKTGIIAEFKRRSPSKGVINDQADPVEVTAQYMQGGASGLSILTDESFFGGSASDLEKSRIHALPILRKDFIVDPYQIIEARSMGADVILLIAACLSPNEVKDLASLAHSLHMEVLLELHDESELDHLNAYTGLVGINNRNLKTFEVDMEKSISMADKIGKAAIRIAESGIREPEDVHTFKNAGFEGFLIGERFMREPDPGAAFAAFVEKLTKA